MNINFLIGNLTKQPEKIEGTQKSLCKFSIAVKENYTNKDGERPLSFFTIVAWGVLADNCVKYLKKGSKVGVVGKLQTRTWEDNDGNKRYATEIVASEIEFLSTKPDTEEAPVEQNNNDYDDDNLPF